MSRLTSLIASLPQPFSKNPLGEPAIALRLNVGGLFLVEDLRLRTTPVSGNALDISLRDITLAQLATTINAATGYTATVTGGLNNIKAYALIEGTYDGSGGITVNVPYFTSTNYQVLAPIGQAFDDLDAAWQEAFIQTDLRHSDGVWLNRLGLLYGLTRFIGEPDVSYARRVALSVIAQKCNGPAIEVILLKGLGVAATTATNAPSRFTTTIVISDTSGNPYNTATINTVIDAYKTFATLNTTVLATSGSESWTMTDVSDALTDTVSTGFGEFSAAEWAARESGA